MCRRTQDFKHKTDNVCYLNCLPSYSRQRPNNLYHVNYQMADYKSVSTFSDLRRKKEPKWGSIRRSIKCTYLGWALRFEKNRTQKTAKVAASSQCRRHLTKSNKANESGKTFIPPLMVHQHCGLSKEVFLKNVSWAQQWSRTILTVLWKSFKSTSPINSLEGLKALGSNSSLKCQSSPALSLPRASLARGRLRVGDDWHFRLVPTPKVLRIERCLNFVNASFNTLF